MTVFQTTYFCNRGIKLICNTLYYYNKIESSRTPRSGVLCSQPVVRILFRRYAVGSYTIYGLIYLNMGSTVQGVCKKYIFFKRGTVLERVERPQPQKLNKLAAIYFHLLRFQQESVINYKIIYSLRCELLPIFMGCLFAFISNIILLNVYTFYIL